MTDRDRRRRAAYERLLRPDSGASETERKVAAAELAKLRAVEPDPPRPVGKEERARRAYRPRPAPDWQDFGSHFRWYSAGGGDGAGTTQRPSASCYDDAPDTVSDAWRKAHNADAVKQQRGWVESIPGWQTSATLTELHSATAEWDAESQRRFKDARVRMTGSSRASDL